jgi:hypothetical protein
LAVGGVGAVTTIGGWFVSGKLARNNALESNKHNNTLKERNEIYAFLLAQGARYLDDEQVDPTIIDRERVAKLNMFASDEVKEAWRDFRRAMQPAGAGGEVGQLMSEAMRNPPQTEAETEAFDRRHHAANDRVREMAEGRYRLLAAAIRAELLPSSELTS